RRETGHVARGTRETCDNPDPDRVGNVHEYDRNRLGGLLEGYDSRATGSSHDDIRQGSDQFFRQRLRLSANGRRAYIDADIAVLSPPEPLQLLPERGHPGLEFLIAFGKAKQHANAAHPLWLLRPYRERPPGRRAAEQRDERAPFHSITSSARAS